MKSLSTTLFMIALATYYLPILFRCYNLTFKRAHIITGTLSVLFMIGAMIQKIGTPDFIGYVGFASAMGAIGYTGYLIMKKGRQFNLWHKIATVGFFVYLIAYIAIF